jgi:hypothetical protein
MAEATIVIASSADAITLTGTDLAAGPVYDDDSLTAWFKLPDIDVKLNKRPNAHGTYLPDRLFAKEARVPMSGKYFGANYLAAATFRDRLAAMFNDGTPVSVTVTDDLGPSSRIGFLVAFEPAWKPDGHFEFDVEFAFPDPRRYGVLASPSVGLPSASSGLVFPLYSTAGGTRDYGTPGSSGRVSFTNTGNTTTYPTLLVGAGGDFAGGFTITEVETGRTLVYSAPTLGGVVRLDSRTQRATIAGGDVTTNLTRREWPAIPARTSRQYQINPGGGVSGSPTLQLLVASANL